MPKSSKIGLYSFPLWKVVPSFYLQMNVKYQGMGFSEILQRKLRKNASGFKNDDFKNDQFN